MSPRISVVLPVLNERESVGPLAAEIAQALQGESYEMVFVDDGSTDGSAREIERMAAGDPRIVAVLLARRYGQTAALAAGLQNASGELIAAMDADGQNDPADISRLMKKIDEGYDVVSGWRKNRQDAFLSRRIPSFVANAIISCVTGVSLHDFGCTLKVYKRSAISGLRLYGEMHRLLPAWCAWRGAKIAEMEVNHRPRAYGKSKYGLGRTFKVLVDLVTAKFIFGYFANPNYIFGAIALGLYALAVLSAGAAIYDKLGPDQWVAYRIPLLLLSCLSGIVGTLLIMLGLIAELIVRLYYEVADENPYHVRRIIRPS